MNKPFFDFDDGDLLMPLSKDLAMDSDGDLLMRLGNNFAMDFDTGELHLTSSWDDEDNDE